MGILDSVILRDTSKRSETAGLAHRAIANAISSFFWSMAKIRNTTEIELLLYGKYHFEEAVRILSGCQEIDRYLLDFGKYLHFCLSTIQESSALALSEKHHTGKDLFGLATSILGRSLQTDFHSGIDLEVFVEACEVSCTRLDFLLSHAEERYVHEESAFCVFNLVQYVATMKSLFPEEEDSIYTLKIVFEICVKYYSMENDGPQCMKYCSELITLCLEKGLDSSADKADCMYCMGMALLKCKSMSNFIERVSNGEKIEGEDGILADNILSYASRINSLSSSFVSISLPRPCCGLGEGFLYTSALQYEICIRGKTISPDESNEQHLHCVTTRDDLQSFYYNLACIGWKLSDKIYCLNMLSKYLDIIRDGSTASTAITSAVNKLREEVLKDHDIRGIVLEVDWFCCFAEHWLNFSKVPTGIL